MKKITAFFLSLILILGMVSTTAFAVGPAQEDPQEANEENEKSIAASGSEDNPYILTAGSYYNTQASGASQTWFKIDNIQGAADFIVTTPGVSAFVTIYRKNTIGKTQVGTVAGTAINYTISDPSKNNGTNSYLIKVSISSAMSSKIMVRQHTDTTTTYFSGGTVWIPKNNSAVPNTSQLTNSLWYVKTGDISSMKDFLEHKDFLDYYDKYLMGSITAVSIATSIFGSGVSEAACRKQMSRAIIKCRELMESS